DRGGLNSFREMLHNRLQASVAPLLALAVASGACSGDQSQGVNVWIQPTKTDVTVNVDATSRLATVAPNAFGIHTSVYDNSLHNARVPDLMHQAGITLMRYPGGGYSDNYHWSTHTYSPSPASPNSKGYLAAGSDFGNYMSLVDASASALMITVNYGTNLA